MTFKTLIDTATVYANLNNPRWQIVDCRFSLEDSLRGYRDYQQQHIPRAIYAHLDHDLSSPVISGQTGRHPLPDTDTLAKLFSRWGIEHSTQVVVYDDNSGAFAGRLWWLLRWLGHESVAVLDGGWSQWEKQALPTDVDISLPTPKTFLASPHCNKLIDANRLLSLIEENPAQICLLDARAMPRYQGLQEPIDPIAGHIPSAHCANFLDNLTPEGVFKTPQALAARFAALNPRNLPVVCYCGSGVTATHNILAMVHAGLEEPRLYAGSWSEWITDPKRPIVSEK